MRSFYFLAGAALLASPILGARQVTVDYDKLQALIKASDDLRATLGYDFTKGTTTTTTNGNSKDALVVDTTPNTGSVTTAYNDISCKNLDPKCTSADGPFKNYDKCYSECVTSQTQKNNWKAASAMAGASPPAGVTNSEVPARQPLPLKRRGALSWFGELFKGMLAPESPAPVNPYYGGSTTTAAYYYNNNNNPYYYNNNYNYYYNRRYHNNAYYRNGYSRRMALFGGSSVNPFTFDNGYYNYYQDRYRHTSPFGLSAFRRRRVPSPWAYAYPPYNPFLVNPAELRA